MYVGYVREDTVDSRSFIGEDWMYCIGKWCCNVDKLPTIEWDTSRSKTRIAHMFDGHSYPCGPFYPPRPYPYEIEEGP